MVEWGDRMNRTVSLRKNLEKIVEAAAECLNAMDRTEPKKTKTLYQWLFLSADGDYYISHTLFESEEQAVKSMRSSSGMRLIKRLDHTAVTVSAEDEK
jgi:hypothetical protein